jgi:hypothetical protein
LTKDISLPKYLFLFNITLMNPYIKHIAYQRFRSSSNIASLTLALVVLNGLPLLTADTDPATYQKSVGGGGGGGKGLLIC